MQTCFVLCFYNFNLIWRIVYFKFLYSFFFKYLWYSNLLYKLTYFHPNCISSPICFQFSYNFFQCTTFLPSVEFASTSLAVAAIEINENFRLFNCTAAREREGECVCRTRSWPGQAKRRQSVCPLQPLQCLWSLVMAIMKSIGQDIDSGIWVKMIDWLIELSSPVCAFSDRHRLNIAQLHLFVSLPRSLSPSLSTCLFVVCDTPFRCRLKTSRQLLFVSRGI